MSLAKFDQELSKGKIQYLAGVDEAGRGPLAGPVVAAAIILPNGFTLDSIKDSKKISEGKRKLIYPEILNNALSVGVGIIHENEIDKINILQGTYKAMKIALGRLQLHPDKVIIDGKMGNIKHYDCNYIINGDNKSQTIAAASIIAKVTRDRIMIEYDKIFPEYGFAQHKGYGTKFHLDAIIKNKATTIHRKSFKPIKSHLPKLSYFNSNEKLIKLSNQLVSAEIIKDGYKILDFDLEIKKIGLINIIHRENDIVVFSRINVYSNGKLINNLKNIGEIKLKNVFTSIINKYFEKKEFDVMVRFDVISVRFSKNKPQISKNKGRLKNH